MISRAKLSASGEPHSRAVRLIVNYGKLGCSNSPALVSVSMPQVDFRVRGVRGYFFLRGTPCSSSASTFPDPATQLTRPWWYSEPMESDSSSNNRCLGLGMARRNHPNARPFLMPLPTPQRRRYRHRQNTKKHDKHTKNHYKHTRNHYFTHKNQQKSSISAGKSH